MPATPETEEGRLQTRGQPVHLKRKVKRAGGGPLGSISMAVFKKLPDLGFGVYATKTYKEAQVRESVSEDQ